MKTFNESQQYKAETGRDVPVVKRQILESRQKDKSQFGQLNLQESESRIKNAETLISKSCDIFRVKLAAAGCRSSRDSAPICSR
jgi:hypothetical protein